MADTSVTVLNLKKQTSNRGSVSKAETTSKKNHFVNIKVSSKVQKTGQEVGFEYDNDVKTDDDFFNKIFSNNCYNPTAESLIDYYLEIRRMIDDAGDREQGNIGTVLGMTVIGLFGFLGFSFTIIGGIAGGVIGGTLGRYAGKKLRRKIKRKGPLTQEQLYITKLQCVVKMGKLQRDHLKHNLNKYRILIEKMIEESSMGMNITLFENTKKITKVLLKLRSFLVSVQPQKAILLTYKLFKIHFKQVDYEDPQSLEEISSKLNKIMIPYIRLIEITENTDKKKIKKLTKLVSYQKIKKLLSKPEIISILEKFPNHRDSQEYLDRFREFLKEKVDLEQPLNNDMQREVQAEAQEQFVGMDGAGSALAHLEARPPMIEVPERVITLQDVHSGELGDESPRKNIQKIRTINIPKSRLFEDNMIGGISIKNNILNGKIFNPQVPHPTEPQSVYLETEGNDGGRTIRLEGALAKPVDEESSDDSSVSREQEQMSLDDATKLVEDSALYEKEESMVRNSVQLASLKNLTASIKKNSPKKDLVLLIPNDSDEKKHSRTNSKSQKEQMSPLKSAGKTVSMENVELRFDPARVTKKPELVKVNSFCDDHAEKIVEEEPEEKKEDEKEKEQEKGACKVFGKHERRRSSAALAKDGVTPRAKGRTPTITKENDEKFNKVVNKNVSHNKTKKELVFEKIMGIAYDNESKWEKVVSNPTVTIQKIKPENSPVILIRGWIFFEGIRPCEVFKQICDISERSRWDTVLAECAVLDKLEDESELFYFCIKTPFGITERDFLQKRQYQVDYPEKGTITMSFQSIEHPAKPPMKNKIRGETHIAGYIIKPSDKAPNSTELCLITQVDIKGNIPKTIVNMVSGRAPAEWVNKLRKACEDFRKRNPNYKWE